MKIEKITENKIRIIVDIDELHQNDMTVQTLKKDLTSAQHLFRNFLQRAEKEVGFKTDDSKLLVEAFATSEGFFVFTFTKLKTNEKQKNLNITKPKVLSQKRPICFSLKNSIYMFDNFDEFCNFCTYINFSKIDNILAVAKKVVLYEYNYNYYLVISNVNKNFEYINLFFMSISEFAKIKTTSLAFENKLIEHGKLILKNNAITNCIKYFVN